MHWFDAPTQAECLAFFFFSHLHAVACQLSLPLQANCRGTPSRELHCKSSAKRRHCWLNSFFCIPVCSWKPGALSTALSGSPGESRRLWESVCACVSETTRRRQYRGRRRRRALCVTKLFIEEMAMTRGENVYCCSPFIRVLAAVCSLPQKTARREFLTFKLSKEKRSIWSRSIHLQADDLLQMFLVCSNMRNAPYVSSSRISGFLLVV